MRFFGGIQDLVLKSKNGFCIFLLNKLRSLISRCIKGAEESTLGKDSSGSFNAPWSEWSWSNLQLFSKETQNSFSDLRI